MPPGIGYGTNINPQIIMRALRQRGLLPPDGPRQPPFVPQGGVTAPPVSPLMQGMQGAQAPQTPQEKPGGLRGFLQTPGLQEGLLAAGSALLAQKDQAGSLGGALGRAIPLGVQGFRQGQQRAEIDEMFEDAPESMRRLMGGLSLPQRQQLMAEMTLLDREASLSGEGGFTLGPGDTRYDSYGRPLASVPDDDDDPSIIRELEEWRAANPDMTPAEQLRSFYEARRAPGTTVNVGQDAAREALVDIEAGDVEEAMDAARAAREQLGSLAQIGRLLDEGVETGAMEERLLPVRQLATAFGVGDAEQLIAQENFRALTNEIAIGMTQQLSGQISERELDFVRAAVPNLGSTPEANRRLVEIGQMANETAIAVAEAKREHFRENGTLAGFEPKRKAIVQDMLLSNLPQGDGSNVDPDARLQELVRQGLTFDEIQEIAKREGWAR